MPIDKKSIVDAIKKLREVNTKRKFTQSLDLQVSLKNTDTKKPENKIKEFIVLPHPHSKKISIAAFVDKELINAAKDVFNEVILKDDFPNYSDKKLVKKLVSKHKFFVSQGNLMGDVAKYFGRYLGPKNRMPDPKAGCVVPIKPELLKPVYEKLQRTVQVRVKDLPNISVLIGTEDMKDDDLADNLLAVYNAIKAKLPRGEEQIGRAYIKMTMSRSVAL